MKKVLKYLTVFVMSVLVLMGNVNNVYAASASLTGPSTVRPGDTITLNLRVSHNGSYGISGTLDYDSSQVTLSGDPTTSLNGWIAERNGNDLVAYDNNLTNPLSSDTTVLTLKFKVSSSIAAGTKVTISVKDLVSSDGNEDTNIGKITYSVTIAQPLSTNANLGSLSVSGATLSPAFSANTTSYDLGEVEYSVSKLNISYTTEDSKAKVSVKSNSLSVGKNTVSIVVTAEDGSTKTYKLTVTRKQDPNYVASTNANLKSMSVSLGMVSPLFSDSVTDYVVYLPYECIGTAFEVTGNASDSKASVIDGKIDKLVEGKNQTVVICKAESGTEKSYAITVVVMPEYTGTVPAIGESTGGEISPEEPTEDTTEDPEDTSTEDSETTSEETSENETTSEDASGDVSKDKSSGNNGLVTILVVVVVIALVGLLIYVLFFGKKRY